MGRHKIWRAQAKKMRRKRFRQKAAQERDRIYLLEQKERQKSPRYQAWLKEQEEFQAFQLEEEERLRHERHLKWEKDEEEAQRLWKERREVLKKIREERARQEVRIREEWEREQEKVRQEEEEEQRKEEEKRQKQEELMKQIDVMLKKGEELPMDMITSNETHPDKPQCPFFSKTGACRFGDWCSRNHVRPSLSKVLLIPNFYSHFGLEQALVEEYDSDVMLEYGESETYQHFKNFFEDVLPEFKVYGRVIQFKVCRNFEPHLRGNVYVEYESTKDAVTAYKKFQGRWYGGKQINVEFTCVSSWRSAICGLYFKQRCPKGRSCNFLHVFRNPGGLFDFAGERNSQSWNNKRRRHRGSDLSPTRSPSPDQSRRSEKRNWRWSESPERQSTSSAQSSERSRARDRQHNGEHSKSSSRSHRSSQRVRSRSRDSGSHRKKHRHRSPGSR